MDGRPWNQQPRREMMDDFFILVPETVLPCMEMVASIRGWEISGTS